MHLESLRLPRRYLVINWRNRIFSNLKNSITDAKFVTEANDKQLEDNTVYFQLLNNVPLNFDMELKKENFQEVNIQIEVYCKSLEASYKLFDKINECMLTMDFARIYGYETMSTSSEFNRLVARYSSFIGSGNVIEKI